MEQTIGQHQLEQKPLIRVEEGLYLAAFGLAFMVRVVVLGRLMLTEFEAEYAWQAFQVSNGDAVGLTNHPAYVLTTGLMFFLFGSGEVMARLLPALVGSAVVLFPYILRNQVGRTAALVAAFGLAFDPLLVAYSRQAGSPMMALGFLALTIFFWQKGRSVTAGLFAGLLLLSGLSMVFGLVVVLIGWGLFSLVGGYRISFSIDRQKLLAAGAGGLAALVIFGTLFMMVPEGLTFMLQAFPDYFAGWLGGARASQSAPMLQILLALAVYQPLALLFGLVVFFERRNFNQPVLVFLMCTFLAVLLLAFFDPAGAVWMLVWALIPLWLLAGTFLGRFLYAPLERDRVLVWGETIFYLVLMVYWWFNLSNMTTQYGFSIPPGTTLLNFTALDTGTKVYLVRLLVTILIPILIAMMTYIVQRGWPGKAALQGTIWGVGIFLVLYLVTAGSGFTDDPEAVAGELWVAGPSSGYAGELLLAVEEASVQITGTRDQLELVYQIDSPLVHWLLRDLPHASYQPVINPNQLPSVILNQKFDFSGTPQDQFYSGQHSALQLERNWEGKPLPPDFDRWLVYRETPIVKDWVVLWTRIDLFPLYQAPPAESEGANP